MSTGNTCPSSHDAQCLHTSDVSCMCEFRGEGFFLRCGYPLRQLATFGFGWVIFMDDYSNTVIVGAPCTLREVRDMVRVSRKKLSFIMDCTGLSIARTVCATSAECPCSHRRFHEDPH